MYVVLRHFIAFILPGCVHAGYISLTTSLGYQYLLSDFTSTSFDDASNQCASQGTTLATLDNTKFQDIVDYLSANSPTYSSFQIWVAITKTSSPDRYYFSSGEEVAADKWFPGEPNENCGSNCCYRMTLVTYQYVTEHKLADHFCSQDYNFICDDIVETTTTTPETTSTSMETTTTTPETTTSTPETPTTTPETTTSTPETSTTTPETTTSTPETSTTTLETTTSTPETSTTTPETTTGTSDTSTTTAETTTSTPETSSNTPETTTDTPETSTTTPETTTSTPETSTTTLETTTNTPETLSTTSETTTTTTDTTISNPETTTVAFIAITTITPSTPPSLPLSSGQQMSIIYIGVIVGGSLAISCCCSSTWLIINRTRRRLHAKHLDEETEEKDEENSDDSGVSSDEDK